MYIYVKLKIHLDFTDISIIVLMCNKHIHFIYLNICFRCRFKETVMKLHCSISVLHAPK